MAKHTLQDGLDSGEPEICVMHGMSGHLEIIIPSQKTEMIYNTVLNNRLRP